MTLKGRTQARINDKIDRIDLYQPFYQSESTLLSVEPLSGLSCFKIDLSEING